jgi:hypothetical protein
VESTFEELAEKSVDDLLESLADYSTRGGLPFDRDRKRAIGKAFLEGGSAQCATSSGTYQAASKDGRPEDFARDAAAIADILLADADQMPLATVSVLIAKYGHDALCGQVDVG